MFMRIGRCFSLFLFLFLSRSIKSPCCEAPSFFDVDRESRMEIDIEIACVGNYPKPRGTSFPRYNLDQRIISRSRFELSREKGSRFRDSRGHGSELFNLSDTHVPPLDNRPAIKFSDRRSSGRVSTILREKAG